MVTTQWVGCLGCFTLELEETQMLYGAGIFTYIWVILKVNVDTYSIHGAYGISYGKLSWQTPLLPLLGKSFDQHPAWKPSATKKPRVLHRCHSTIVLPVEIVIKCDMLRTKLGRKIEHNSLKIMRAPQKPGVSRSSSSCSLHSNVQMFMSVYRISTQAHSCNLIQALTYCKHNRTTLVQPGSPTCNNMQHAMTTNLR